MQKYYFRTTIFLLLYVTKGSWNVGNRTFRVSYGRTRITLECVVSPLNSRLTFELNGTEVGVCSPPIPKYINGTCTSEIGEITQNILQEKTTLTFQYAALDKINGIWECCHATGKDSCITKPVKNPFNPDPDNDCPRTALIFVLLWFLPALFVSVLGYFCCIKTKSGPRYLYQLGCVLFYLITIGGISAVAGYVACYAKIHLYLYFLSIICSGILSLIIMVFIYKCSTARYVHDVLEKQTV